MKKTLASIFCILSLAVVTACTAPDVNDSAKTAAGRGKDAQSAEATVKSIQAQAEQGDALAQYELGTDLRKGWSVPQDWEQAYFWLSLATAANERFSDNASIGRNLAAFHLTPAQIAAEDKRIAAWKPVPAPVTDDGEKEKAAPAPGTKE